MTEKNKDIVNLLVFTDQNNNKYVVADMLETNGEIPSDVLFGIGILELSMGLTLTDERVGVEDERTFYTGKAGPFDFGLLSGPLFDEAEQKFHNGEILAT